MNAELILFGMVGLVAIASALVVVLHPNPVYSALALVVALFQVAAVFVLLDAHMIAFLQIIVYAGAIMVLFLFVIMLLNVQQDPETPSLGWRGLTGVAGAVLVFELAGFFLTRTLPSAAAEPIEGFGSVLALARSLFTQHVLAFELTSVLLLVAIIGAVVIARRE